MSAKDVCTGGWVLLHCDKANSFSASLQFLPAPRLDKKPGIVVLISVLHAIGNVVGKQMGGLRKGI